MRKLNNHAKITQICENRSIMFVPKKYTDDEIVAMLPDIFQRISNGELPSKILKDLEISRYKFMGIIEKDPIRAIDYKRAEYCRMHHYGDESIDIAETEPDPNRARVKIDTRKFLMSKLASQTFGDKIDINMNQTIDIGTALGEAMKRTALNQHSNSTREVQAIEIPVIELPKESVVEAVADMDADIFEDEDELE